MEYCNKKSTSEESTIYPRIWKVLTLLGLGLAVIAMLASIASLTVMLLLALEHKSPYDSSSLQEAERSLEPMRSSQENEELVSQLIHKKHYHGHRNQRSMACSSEINKNITPTAHITPLSASGYQNFTFESNKVEILTDKWFCDFSYTKAHVGGGMSFVDGFLKVPFDGVYFIYSQISLEAQNSTEAREGKRPIIMGHSTIICDCVDKTELKESCKCYTEESQSVKLTGNHNMHLLQSASETFGSVKGAHFHGGLFRLTANSYISIVPVVSRHDNPETKVYARYTNSFYGGFLVSQNSN